VLGLLPGLAHVPAAALTTLGAVQTDAAPGFHNTDGARGGITVQAGGAVQAPRARWTTAPGAAPLLSVVAHDEALRARDAAHFFSGTFGLDQATWRQQPDVLRPVCDGDCSEALRQALAAAPWRRRVWFAGDVQLAAPLVLGTPERPLILVVGGRLTLVGPLQVHGVVHAGALEWSRGPGAGTPLLRGAALSEGGYRGDAAADFVRDTDVLNRLRSGAGSFARLPGSWRDF